MAISGLEKDAALQNRETKQREVQFRARITANATPASKVHNGEIPLVAVLRSQGKTAEADAVEDLSAAFATPADATGIFNILLKGAQLGDVDQVVSASATAVDGGTAAVTIVNAGTVAYGVSAGGNVALNVDSSLSLAAANCDIIIALKYYLK